ncbi:MAG: SGNH/GDSL hydrolase family protein [Chloroflexota bacterium]
MKNLNRSKLVICVTTLIMVLVIASALTANTAAIAKRASATDATWTASPMAPTSFSPNLAVAGFNDQTVRNVIYTSIGGNELRVRLSNTFGTSPLHVGGVSVGIVLTGAQLVPGTTHTVTFGGHSSVTLPAGDEAISDPLSLTVAPLEDLAISLYLPMPTGPATYHSSAQQTNYVATGDHASDVSPAAYTTTATSWYFLDGVEVRNAHAPGSVVAFGDSITDGYQSQIGANDRWPNFLARRLDAKLGSEAPSVVDEGIGGNRILNDSPCFGVNALARFKRDVLSQPGVRDVILLEGINDIGFSQLPNTGCFSPNTNVSAAQIIEGYEQIIRLAHAHGLKIFGGTLTSFKGALYWSPAAEVKREEVNHWIRTSGAFDGVIDFARALQDPFDPQYINPPYNTRDNLHPNDAGYEAMGNAINLALLQ